MIVGACHSTSALVINPCTIANSFGAGYSTLHANRAGAGKALLRASCSKGSADSRSQPYGDPAQSTEDRRGPARANERPGGASLLLPARGAYPSGQWDPCEGPARSRRGLNRTAVAFQLQSVRAVVPTRRSDK